MDQSGFADGAGEVGNHAAIMGFAQRGDLHVFGDAADIGHGAAGEIDQVLFDQGAHLPLGAIDLAHRDRHPQARAQGLVDVDILAADQVFAEEGRSGSSAVASVMASSGSMVPWKSMAQAPSLPTPRRIAWQSSMVCSTGRGSGRTVGSRARQCDRRGSLQRHRARAASSRVPPLGVDSWWHSIRHVRGSCRPTAATPARPAPCLSGPTAPRRARPANGSFRDRRDRNRPRSITCQASWMRKGSWPIRSPAHCSMVDGSPPSPIPNRPLSVSMVTMLVDWLKVGWWMLGRPAASVGVL